MTDKENSRSGQMQRIAEGYVGAKLFAGIEWQVDVGGSTLSEGRVGSADGDALPIPDQAIYRIFSMTKPIVSVLALQLVEQGRLRLYDMVAQYDERFAQMTVLGADGSISPAQRPITVENLLTHRAGFTYEFLHGCHIAQYYRDHEINANGGRSLDEMMGVLSQLPLAFQPGTEFRYSVSIDVLAHVIERATGERLDQLLQTYLFGPLGMEDTGFTVSADKLSRLMPMFGADILDGSPPLEMRPQVLTPLNLESMYPVEAQTFLRGGLGLYSTTNDYMAFARMLLTGTAPDGSVLISRKMLEALRANRIPEQQLPLKIGPNVLAGYGWGLIGRVHLGPGQGMSLSSGGEFGWAGAATTYFWVDPTEDMIGVVMTQYLGSALPLSDDMRTAAYQALP